MTHDLSHINSLETLRTEKRVIRNSLNQQEADLKRKMQELPAELAAAGANTLIPKMLRGKVTNTALKGGKFLINKFFVDSNGPKLLSGPGKPGVLSVVKNVFKLIRKK
ncbi:hypothetical protein EXU57_18295 [Segetibacter sp. 3557_3]|uniref:hypothetical protein n=1 Tax=Segetibacter sp. 3557_3 TaxID=2547429 RepID=UPI0010586850|nr:hypothetical protein [Segetibacter sp. 3557_3]TDH23012.1 hypothetical protein EXU57_18295 [Segetibacter sp. 3557_3]